MKKYLSLVLLLLAMTVVACGTDETKDTDVNNPVKDQAEVEIPNDPVEPVEPDTPVADEDTSNNKYEGIDMESTLPGREWVQTTFPGVIDTPKIVIYNDTTNRKTIVEEGEVVVYNESDTFAIYLPEGVEIDEGSNLISEYIKYDDEYCEEIKFDMEYLIYQEQGWKKKYGGAKFEIVLDNNGVEEELTCIISLGD